MTVCWAPASYLSIFSSQVERGPEMVVGWMRVGSTLQQHRHHLPVAAGTRYVQLQRQRANKEVSGSCRISLSQRWRKRINTCDCAHQSDAVVVGQVEASSGGHQLSDIREHGAGALHLHCGHRWHVHAWKHTKAIETPFDIGDILRHLQHVRYN